MQNWIDDRRNWYLPLVGGAEMNRVKPGAIYYLTSLPYPIVETDTFGNTYGVFKVSFPPSTKPSDEFRNTFGVIGFKMSEKLGDKDYTVAREDFSSTMGIKGFAMSAKLTTQYYNAGIDEYSNQMSVKKVARFSALQFYVHPELEEFRSTLTIKGISRK